MHALDTRLLARLERAAHGLTIHQLLAVSATGTVPQGVSHVLATTSGGSVTLTLPTAAAMLGRVVVFVKLTAANTLTVQGNGSENINGANTMGWTTQWEPRRLLSDGTQWVTV